MSAGKIPTYWEIESQSKPTTPIHNRAIVRGYEEPRCFYCGRREKPEFPLTSKTLSFKDENGRKVVVKVCPICYYERWGFRSLAGRWGKNDNRYRFVKIQRNYVISLKRTNPKRLAEIQESLYTWIKLEVSRKISDPKKQAKRINQLAKARIFL